MHESINRDRNFKEGLRSIAEICGTTYDDAINRTNSIFSHFSRPMTVLSLERDDISIAGSLPLFLLYYYYNYFLWIIIYFLIILLLLS